MKMRLGVYTQNHRASINERSLSLDLIAHEQKGLVNMELAGTYDIVTTKEGLQHLVNCANSLLQDIKTGDIIPDDPTKHPPPPGPPGPPEPPIPPVRHKRITVDTFVQWFNKTMTKLNITWEN